MARPTSWPKPAPGTCTCTAATDSAGSPGAGPGSAQDGTSLPRCSRRATSQVMARPTSWPKPAPGTCTYTTATDSAGSPGAGPGSAQDGTSLPRCSRRATSQVMARPTSWPKPAPGTCTSTTATDSAGSPGARPGLAQDGTSLPTCSEFLGNVRTN